MGFLVGQRDDRSPFTHDTTQTRTRASGQHVLLSWQQRRAVVYTIMYPASADNNPAFYQSGCYSAAPCRVVVGGIGVVSCAAPLPRACVEAGALARSRKSQPSYFVSFLFFPRSPRRLVCRAQHTYLPYNVGYLPPTRPSQKPR